MMRNQPGIPFEFKKHWRRLFDGESYFFYKRTFNTDEICLAKFNVLTVARWYFYQVLISVLNLLMNPLCRLADRYWRLDEGADYIHITGNEQQKIKQPYWFKMGKVD